jgi:hypothetical protein
MKKILAMLGIGTKIDPDELDRIEELAKIERREEGGFPPDSVK